MALWGPTQEAQPAVDGEREGVANGSGGSEKDAVLAAVPATGESSAAPAAADNDNDQPVSPIEKMRLAASIRKSNLAGEDPTWEAAIMNSVLLSKLPAAELKYLKGALKQQHCAAGEVLYVQDDVATQCFIVQSGKFAAVQTLGSRGTRRLREYTTAALFGTHEMLHMVRRSCSVECTSAGVVWVINKRIFDSKLKVCPTAQKALLEHVMAVPLFSQLSPPMFQQLARCAVELKFAPGELLCRLGDKAQSIFILIKGSCVHSRWVEGMWSGGGEGDAGKLRRHRWQGQKVRGTGCRHGLSTED